MLIYIKILKSSLRIFYDIVYQQHIKIVIQIHAF